MKYNKLVTMLIFFFLVVSYVYSQETKIKKSDFNDMILDARLRKQSLELEREYLRRFLDSLKILDSLKNELENCKKSLDFNNLQENLELNLFTNDYPYEKNFDLRLISRNRK